MNTGIYEHLFEEYPFNEHFELNAFQMALIAKETLPYTKVKRTLHTKEEITPEMLKKAIKVLKQYKPKREKPYYVQVENPRVFHVKMFIF
ncbi:MAG: hypothetical protein E3J83_04330 [Candidatus Atribacteria bacterium]|nr:MAG: hypothetical protein E3J83_04330 [Candidatus Atribacteria bacterium]